MDKSTILSGNCSITGGATLIIVFLLFIDNFESDFFRISVEISFLIMSKLQCSKRPIVTGYLFLKIVIVFGLPLSDKFQFKVINLRISKHAGVISLIQK